MNNNQHYHFAGAHFDRRRAILGTAAALAGAALIRPVLAEPEDHQADDRPQATPRRELQFTTWD